MERIPLEEVRKNFDDVVNLVANAKQRFLVSLNDEDHAAIIPIGNGSTLTEEQVEQLGRLVATIDSVEIASPPVVEFTVKDSNGNPAVGIAEGVVWFTIAKLVPADPSFNGGLAYWQSYVNRIETPTEGKTQAHAGGGVGRLLRRFGEG